jgi:hypothetical protein
MQQDDRSCRKSDSALLTDLYQLNTLAAYLDHGLTETAVSTFRSPRFATRRNGRSEQPNICGSPVARRGTSAVDLDQGRFSRSL